VNCMLIFLEEQAKWSCLKTIKDPNTCKNLNFEAVYMRAIDLFGQQIVQLKLLI
jgi:hypothetical protein